MEYTTYTCACIMCMCVCACACSMLGCMPWSFCSCVYEWTYVCVFTCSLKGQMVFTGLSFSWDYSYLCNIRQSRVLQYIVFVVDVFYLVYIRDHVEFMLFIELHMYVNYVCVCARVRNCVILWAFQALNSLSKCLLLLWSLTLNHSID